MSRIDVHRGDGVRELIVGYRECVEERREWIIESGREREDGRVHLDIVEGGLSRVGRRRRRSGGSRWNGKRWIGERDGSAMQELLIVCNSETQSCILVHPEHVRDPGVLFDAKACQQSSAYQRGETRSRKDEPKVRESN